MDFSFSTMTSKLFIFIAGSFSCLFWPNLPSLSSLILLVLAALSLTVILPKCAYFLIGMIWMASVGHWQCSLQLSSLELSEPILVAGKVTSLIKSANDVRFNLSVTHIDQQHLWVNRKLRLSWRKPLWPLAQGQTVQLMVKVKPIHGLANEGGFNYQQWLFSEGFHGAGYVKLSDTHLLLEATTSARQQLLNKILAMPLQQKKWLLALAIGYRGLLTPDDWQIVQKTGVAHLIAISGLHLGLVASLSYLLMAWLLGMVISRVNGWHNINLHKTALLVTLFSTFAYAGIAGFGLPSLRAWIMLTLFTCVLLSNRSLASIKILAIGLCIFVLLFPLSLFGASFWLSFSAVITIWFIFWRWPIPKAKFSLRTTLISMVKIQLGLSLLMLPVVAWQFSYISLSAPLANLVAVPVVTFLLVPLCLLAIICLAINVSWALVLFKLADYVIGSGITLLALASELSWSALDIPSIPNTIWVLILLAIIWMLLPQMSSVVLHKKYALLLVLPLLSYLIPAKSNSWTLDVLDVGQGVAVLITRNKKAILYDVGAKYPSGFNMADSVILPVLRSRGIKHVDYVFISHGDNDHAGSLDILKAGMSVDTIATNFDTCQQGMFITWQQLELVALWPDTPQNYSNNNGSCVLTISDGINKVLLSGDIDKNIEGRLVDELGSELKADILLAPHHGSNTSSSQPFIDMVNPSYVVFSQGFQNRWGFPRSEVVTRYQAKVIPESGHILEKQDIQRELFNTSGSGQVSFVLQPNEQPFIQAFTRRQNIFPYWYANMPNCCSN